MKITDISVVRVASSHESGLSPRRRSWSVEAEVANPMVAVRQGRRPPQPLAAPLEESAWVR